VLLSIEYETRNEFLEISEAVEKCFKCATCALVCPVTRYVEGYGPRNTFVYDIFSSAEPAANKDIWSCASCHKCYEVCPQDVNPAMVFESLKEVSFKNGWAPPNIVALVEAVIHTGRAFPITDTTKRIRAQLALPPLTSEVLNDMSEIVKNTGLEERLDKEGSKKS
jgi:heterodisulfide reductase subunit C